LRQCLALSDAAGTRLELLALLDRVAPRTSGEPARSAVHRALAQLREESGELPQAVESWRVVLAAHADDAPALASLARLLEKLERHDELLEVLRKQRALAGDDAAKAELLWRIGVLQDDTLREADGALQ